MRLLETIRELKVNQRQGLEASSDLQSEAFTPIGEEGKKLLREVFVGRVQQRANKECSLVKP